MSVAFETNTDTNRIRQPGFSQGMWIYNSPDNAKSGGDDQDQDQDSTTSSSVGNNSDDSGGDSDDDVRGSEVQSLFKGSLNNLCALEDALPVKRGISTFYAGKSKSYTSLADAVSAPSIQDIVKPEDASNRKRKNMLAQTVLLEINRNITCKSNGISKKLADSNRDALNNNNNHHDSGESLSHGGSLPPLPARPTRLPTTATTSNDRIYCSPWRSLSLSDLQHAAGATSSSSNKRDK